jgi:hypothetical protein
MIFEDEIDLFGFQDEVEQQVQLRNFRPRQYYELEDFAQRFRFNRAEVQDLLNVLGPSLGNSTTNNHPLSALDKLLMALRFYSTGSF